MTRTEEGFEVRTADRTYRARHVVVATGPFQIPFVAPSGISKQSSATRRAR
jgi:putative flavoprotein involved in K+ transport